MEVKPINPSDIPSTATPIVGTVVPAPGVPKNDDFGTLTGKAMADKYGTAYDPNNDVPLYEAKTSGGGGGDDDGPSVVMTVDLNDNGDGTFSFTLPNGVQVTMGRPPFAVPLRVCQILAQMGAGMSQDPLAVAYARAILYVRKLNGKDVKSPGGYAEMQHLMNQLGDQGIDAAVGVYATKWPSVQVKDLPLSAG